MFKLVLEKAEEPEVKLSTSTGSLKKQESSRRTSTFALYAKAFDYVEHNKLWKILKEMGIPDHLTCLLRNLYVGQEATVRTLHGTTECFRIGKGVWQGCVLSPCCLTTTQSTSFKMQAGWSTSWNQDCWEKYQQPQIWRWYHLNGRKWRGTKEPLDDGERGE